MFTGLIIGFALICFAGCSYFLAVTIVGIGRN